MSVQGKKCRCVFLAELTISFFVPFADPPHVFKVLGALADNAKHNQQGRVDEYGALRHRVVELCPVGALARMMFAYFHIINQPIPNFEPDFADQKHGEYGRREWYEHVLFYGDRDVKSEMSYDSKCLYFCFRMCSPHSRCLCQITTNGSTSSIRPTMLTSQRSPMLAGAMVQ